MSRRAGIFGALAASFASAAGGAWWQLARRPLPQTEGSLTVQGIDREVQIRRDRWGVPHVHAGTRNDLWFGQGFCQGQDRLWQLDLYRRAASGRVAELAGPDALPADRFLRTLGMRRSARRELGEIDPGLRQALDALAAGINAGAAAAAAPPIEFQLLRMDFEPWTAEDSLCTHKLLSFGLSTNWERELLRADMARELGPELAARLDPSYPADNPAVISPSAVPAGGVDLAERVGEIKRFLGMTPEPTGSNNWAVAGSRTTTGRALIAGDPHLPPSMPGITYQMGLYADGRRCRGATLAGMPGVVFGQNDDVAWTFTNAMADVMDLFVERIEGDRYQFEGDWRELDVVEETVPVRGAADERLVIRRTHHGPLVNEALRSDEADPLALSWALAEVPAITAASTGILDARDGPELLELLAQQHSPVSNLVWADRHGSFGYKTIGLIPRRRGGSPDLPRCGWSGEDEWEGFVPYEELPELTDPDAGYVVTANNRITHDGPHITSDYLDGYRARRIEELIEETELHDLDSFARMQLDLHSRPGVETARRLARLRPRDQAELRAIERLRSWDGRMTPDSVAATIYQAFTLWLGRELTRAAIGDRDLAERWLDRAHNGFLDHVTSPWRWQSHLLALWAEEDEELVGRPWADLVLDALRGALTYLADRYGDDPESWRWGRVHELRFPHVLGAANPVLSRIFDRALEVGGGQETVTQVGWDPNDPFTAIWAPCWRMVADPADPERSRWQQFTGNSGHVGSEHYDDLMPRWRDGLTQPMSGEAPWRVLTLEPEVA